MPTLRTHCLALRVFLEPGPVLEQAVTIVRTVAWSMVLHGLYYCYKEKKDGLFSQPSVALSATGGRAPGA